jgi:hypothetical protein
MRHFAGLGNQAERSDKGRAALSRFLESQRASCWTETADILRKVIRSAECFVDMYSTCIPAQQKTNSRGRFTRLSSISCFGTGPNIPCLSLHLLCLDAPECFVDMYSTCIPAQQKTRCSAGIPETSTARPLSTRLSSISCFGTGPNIPCLSLHLLCLDAP